MATNFSFPMLTRKEIVAIIAESEIGTIREEDLANPTHDFAVSLYTHLLVYLDPLQEDYGQADFNAISVLENPDLHVDSVRTMNLCHKIKEVVAAVSCPTNFTLRDLLKPDKERTRVFLSAILNFCLHRETKLNLLQPYVDQVNLTEERRSELENKISQLNMEMSDLRDASEREQPFVQAADAKVKELRQTIQGLNTHQMSLKTSFRALRDKVQEIEKKIINADFVLTQSAQENEKLRSKIVQSPEKLQGALEEKKSIQAEVKNSERVAMQAFQEKTATLEVYSKASKKMSKHLTRMQAIQEQVSSAKTIDKDLKALKAKLSDDGVQDKSLEAKLVERQGKVEQLEESWKALEKERDLKHEESAKELDNLKREIQSKSSDLASKEEKVNAKVAEAESMKLKITSVRESGLSTQQGLHHKSEEIVNEFHNYSHSVGDLMQRIEAGVDCRVSRLTIAI